MNQAPVAEVSTAQPSSPVTTETPQVPNAPKPTLHELHTKALEEFRKGEERGPEEKPAETVEGQENKTPEEPTTEDAPKPEDDFVEKVKYGDSEAPIEDVLKDAEFEFQSAGGLRTVEGLDKVMRYASIGYDAAQKNATAKQAIVEAQNIIKEIEAGQERAIQEGVGKQLDQLLNMALGGINPATNQPFDNPQDKARAVELATRMRDAGGNNAKETSLSPDDIKKQVKAELEAERKAENQKRQEAEKQSQVEKTAQENLKRVVDPLKQFFLEDDGKTLNTMLWDSYLTNVQTSAASNWVKAGSPRESSEINKFVEEASKSVFNKFKSSLNIKKADTNGTKQPQVKPTGGGGLPQATTKPPKFRDLNESVAWHKARLGLK